MPYPVGCAWKASRLSPEKVRSETSKENCPPKAMAGVTVSGGLFSYPHCAVLTIIKGLRGDALPMHLASTLNSPHVSACHLSPTVASSAESCPLFLLYRERIHPLILPPLVRSCYPTHSVQLLLLSPALSGPSPLSPALALTDFGTIRASHLRSCPAREFCLCLSDIYHCQSEQLPLLGKVWGVKKIKYYYYNLRARLCLKANTSKVAAGEGQSFTTWNYKVRFPPWGKEMELD